MDNKDMSDKANLSFHCAHRPLCWYVGVDMQWLNLHIVNSENFAIILFSRIALKYKFATLKIHDKA